MSREEIYQRLNEVASDVFDEENLQLNDETTADDVDAWDSLTHLGFVNEVEIEFDVKFTLAEIRNFKNVGELVDAIERHLA